MIEKRGWWFCVVRNFFYIRILFKISNILSYLLMGWVVYLDVIYVVFKRYVFYKYCVRSSKLFFNLKGDILIYIILKDFEKELVGFLIFLEFNFYFWIWVCFINVFIVFVIFCFLGLIGIILLMLIV